MRTDMSSTAIPTTADVSEAIGYRDIVCGFTHLGRFAVDYRRRFGTYPSQTLRS